MNVGRLIRLLEGFDPKEDIVIQVGDLPQRTIRAGFYWLVPPVSLQTLSTDEGEYDVVVFRIEDVVI